MIRNMKDRGMSNREIANEPGISRNTVRKMIKATGTPEPKRRKRASKLDPYRQGIRELIEKYRKSPLPALFRRFLHCDIFPHSFPAYSSSPCYLTYVHSLFVHGIKHMPILCCKRIYNLQHENAWGDKYSMAENG